jgi:hypothetical protein
LDNYQSLFTTNGLTAKNDLFQQTIFVLNNWMEKPYFERLSEKSKAIKQCLPFPKND